jgi:hypothetical protein
MPVATPLPVASATPKPGFWSRIFGRRKHATPAPHQVVPTTPKPTSSSKSTGRGKTEATSEKTTTSKREKTDRTEKPEKSDKPEKSEDDRPKSSQDKPKATTSEPDKPKDTAETKVTPEPKPTKTTKPKSSSAPSAADTGNNTPPEGGADPETVERTKFADAKRKAAEDPEVNALKEKADNAGSEDEARKALRDYNRALFQKMRKLEPSIKERIDATEAAIMRRLNGE